MNALNTIPTQEELKEQTYVCTAIPFELGKMVMTQGIADIIDNNIGSEGSLGIALIRHKNGDWGNVCIEDKITNDEATRTGERVLSEYKLCGERIWIITERDRSVTTVLLPSEY
ncbi:type I restriction endonuclease subunit M [Vibrio parahaemolyticus]|nr:type I restriction endonuclease subunit M [Vibrio parahaemolyticus]EKG9663405.1 type I restriction endonuclease subunit M [Vibrio parahaemolyticus]EKG9668985.1 type I restriction endonuclease subunit M [Vibrio parahaemolyticus]